MDPSESRTGPLCLAGLLIAAGAVGYVFGLPLWEATRAGAGPSEYSRWQGLPLGDRIQLRLFEALVAGWFFFFGACLGSFLNVVIYRTPRGRSLLGRSHCPRCGHAIRWYDNIPVFSWLGLRARCRDCSLPIAVRYPVVEGLVGSIFLTLAMLELFLEGVNLPGGPPFGYRSVSWLIGPPQTADLATFIYHAVLLCVLLSWALIKLDGYRLPGRYVLLVVLWGFVLPLGLPAVQPVVWADPRPAWTSGLVGATRLDTGFVGAVVGAALGWMTLVAQQRGGRHILNRPHDRYDGAAALGVVGLHLGWQAAVSVTLLATTLQLLGSLGSAGRLSRNHAAFFAYVAIASVWQIIGWRSLDDWAGWPDSRCDMWLAVGWAGPCLLQAYVAGYLARTWSLPTGQHQQDAA